MTTAWAYTDPRCSYMIVKRNPSSYHIPTLDVKSGEIDFIVSFGTEFSIPVWDWIQTKDSTVWAKYNGLVYDITDLSVCEEAASVAPAAQTRTETEKSLLEQEGPT